MTNMCKKPSRLVHIGAVVTLSTVFTYLFPITARAATFTFTDRLDSLQQVPPVETQGQGTATSVLEGDPSNWTFSSTISFSGLTSPLLLQPDGGHIHNAPAGSNGPIFHTLENLPAGTTSGTFSDVWSSTQAATSGLNVASTYNGLLNGNFYFNLHTTIFPDGEIRGQIVNPTAAPEPSAVPEPSSVLGTCIFGAFGTGLMLKRSWKKQKSSNSIG